MTLDIRSAALPVAAVAVLTSAVLAAAVGGSWELEERDFGRVIADPTAETRGRDAMTDLMEDLPPPAEAPFDLGWLKIVGWVLVAALTAAAIWWFWTWLRRRPLPRRRHAIGDAGAAAVAVEEPQLPVLRRGVAEAQRFLEQISSPTDAVIAAWLALEEAATASGVRRAASQTPTEFTLAVLERTDADPAATTELLSLYHRARFSGDPVGNDDVGRASGCLGRLAASWDAVAVASGGMP